MEIEVGQGSSTDSRVGELRLRIRVVLQETVKAAGRERAKIVCDWRIDEVKKFGDKIIPTTKIRLRNKVEIGFVSIYAVNINHWSKKDTKDQRRRRKSA